MTDHRIPPHFHKAIDPSGDPLTDVGTYGLVFDGDRFVGWGEAGGGGGGSIIYGQTNKTATVSRNATGGTSWASLAWLIAHHHYLRVLSFACDIFQSDTYTLSIDGEDVGSAASTGASAPFALTITLGTAKVLTRGPHVFRLRGTAARRFYYNNSPGVLPTGGTYPNIQWSSWLGPATEATPHGTLTFDAEGVLT